MNDNQLASVVDNHAFWSTGMGMSGTTLCAAVLMFPVIKSSGSLLIIGLTACGILATAGLFVMSVLRWWYWSKLAREATYPGWR